MSQSGLQLILGLRDSHHLVLSALASAGLWFVHSLNGEENSSASPVFPGFPEPVTDANFAALKENSPFLRSLDLSKSLILTGIAGIGGEVFVTLLERDTKETHVVSGSANPKGWRLVEIAGDQTDLESVTAQISMTGGQVFAVRFDERQLKPGEGKPGGGSGGSSGSGGKPPTPERDYREGVSGDGFSGAPPPELVQKLSKLNEDTRNRLIQEIRVIRDKRQFSSEERQVMFTRMVDRALQERR